MKKSLRIILLFTAVAFLSSFYVVSDTLTTNFKFPYQKAGLTKEEAAAHLLNRFSFGATPGEVQEVIHMGLENWFQQQLDASQPDDSLEAMLTPYESLKMTNKEIVSTFPKPGQLVRMAVQEGIIDKDSIQNADRKEVRQFMMQKGYKPQQELFRQLINQKILRAAYSNNQLKEVLTDFWFNHFNVSLTKGEDQQFLTSYERDVIRPNVLGNFETLLLATAKSPAMLTFLDNFRSSGTNEKLVQQQEKRQQRMLQMLQEKQGGDTSMQAKALLARIKNAKKASGLNENYAREIMELHTLGVDGGYTQSDVTQGAKILTGWTIYPMGPYAGPAVKQMEKQGEERLKQQGFVHEGDFVFNAVNHDTGPKKFLGVDFPAGGGYEEGLKMIHMLATNQSTAKFISKKLAVRFVSDNPPATLVNKMAKTYMESNGNIKQVLITMATAPEFWTKDAIREKTKSPFELAISAVRGMDASINQPFQLYNWITRMGEKLYYYQAPTGYPDRGQYWINTGSLLNRMNFGLAIATGRIPGIKINLAELNNNHEPESADAALTIYSKLLLPGRNVEETVKRLKPLLSDPELTNKIETAAGKNVPKEMNDNMADDQGQNRPLKNNKGRKLNTNIQMAEGNNSMLGQVVGIIIGSPEFQRK
jgi:uncharacterized protein (DUF1800 family)